MFEVIVTLRRSETNTKNDSYRSNNNTGFRAVEKVVFTSINPMKRRRRRLGNFAAHEIARVPFDRHGSNRRHDQREVRL